MNLTGAELITRFLLSRTPAASVAVFGHGALRPLLGAFAQAGLKTASRKAPDVLAFDFAGSLSAVAPLLSAARIEHLPLVAIAAQVRRSLIGTPLCEPAVVRRQLDPLGRHAFHVNVAAELVQLLPEAFRLAHSGRGGPVLLEIPEDVFSELIQGAWIPPAPVAPTRARASRAAADLALTA